MPTTLGQIVAIDTSTKTQVQGEFDQLYHNFKKADLFRGMNKVHEPFDGFLPQPATQQLVQANAHEMLLRIEKILTRKIDVEATKNLADTTAKADVVLDGRALLANVPITTLLFLKNEISNFLTVFKSIPVQSLSERWEPTTATGMYRTPEEIVPSTAKISEHRIIVPPTDKFPAQTQLVSEDRQSGTYKTVKFTAALPVNQRDALVERTGALLDAIKQAIVVANHEPVTDVEAGATIFNYLLDGTIRQR